MAYITQFTDSLIANLGLINLGGYKHYRGSTAPTNPNPGDTWDEITTGNAWVETWFWTGSLWMSTNEYNKDSSIVAMSASSTIYYDVPVDTNVYVTNFKVGILLGSTNSALTYWTFALSRATGATSSTALGSTLSTASATANNWFNSSTSINTLINIATSGTKAFRVDVTKVTTPSNIAGAIEVRYRTVRP